MTYFILVFLLNNAAEREVSIVSFDGDKYCSSLQCNTYTKTVVDVSNLLDYPIKLQLKCVYHKNNEHVMTVYNEFFLNGRKKIRTINEVTFQSDIDETSFFSVGCSLLKE
jgi:hypothetical protein